MATQVLAERVLEYAAQMSEGTPISAKALLHLGRRAALDQTLSRLARRGRLMRAGRGVYVRPVETRFGVRAPSVERVVEGLARLRGETVVPHGAAAANALGLTTQVPVRAVYLTSGPSRRLKLGAQVVELRHAPRWQLAHAGRPAGDAIRALAWLGPARVEEALTTLKGTLAEPELQVLAATRAALPEWLARSVSATVVGHG